MDRVASLANRKSPRRRLSIICSAQIVLLGATIFSLGTRETVKAATDPAQVAALHTIASTLASSNPFFHAWSGNDPCAAVGPAAAADPSSKGWPGVTCESDSSGNHVVTALGNDPCAAVAPAAADPSGKGWSGVTCESDGSGNHVVTALGNDPCAAVAPAAADPSGKGWPGVTCESDGSGNHVVTVLYIAVSGYISVSCLFLLPTYPSASPFRLTPPPRSHPPSSLNRLSFCFALPSHSLTHSPESHPPPFVFGRTLQGLGLSGQLPAALFELTALTSLDISLNPALTGSIYSTISALSDLSMLDMHGCNLSGSIPSTIGLLRKLNFFAVNSNQLSGSIPRQVANLTDLWFFDITDNNISGPVPVQPGFDTCTSIGHLHMSRNQLTYIPGELGRLPTLIHLLVDNNRLNQTFPVGLSGSTSLQIIHLSNNTIQGRLPPSLNLPALQDL
ncbi:unnamed protein product [Closterium sp. NIES-54]